jgi:hypothetical protein
VSKAALVSLLALLAAGCVTTPEELAALDFGACPTTHETTIRAYFQDKTFPPVRYNGEPMIWPAKRFHLRNAPLRPPGHLIWGWLVVAAEEQTFGPNTSEGLRLYGFVFRGEELVGRLDPPILDFVSLKSRVGPLLPFDGREWLEGPVEVDKGLSISTYALHPDDPSNGASEEITVVRNPGIPLEVSLEPRYEGSAAVAKDLCADATAKILSSSPTEILFEENNHRCYRHRDEHTIRKLIRAPEALFIVSYKRSTPLSTEEHSKWTELLGNVHVLGDCEAQSDSAR